MRNPFRYFNSSPEVIRLVVMMYIRYPLSLRQVEDILFERGIDICHETVRYWWNRFGPMFAAAIRKRRLHHRSFSQWRWHLDEVFVRINGETHYLWRAIDHEGEVLEVFATKRRDRRGERAKHCAAMWQDLKPNDRRALLGAIVARVQVFADRIDVIVNRAQVALWLLGHHDESKPGATASAESAGLLLTLTVPARLRRAGKEMRIVLEDASGFTAPDPSLLRLLIRANAIRDRLLADRSLTLEEIAKEEKMVASYATRLFRLTLLAPNIVGAILNGNQPPELTARKLMDDTRLPLDWNEQRRALGFA